MTDPYFKCQAKHVSTQEDVILNQAKGWKRELDRHFASLGKTFAEGRADLTRQEQVLYLAVKSPVPEEG